MKIINLAIELKEEIKNNPNMTVDEFFNKYNIPAESRTDFGMAAILNKTFERVTK